MNLKSLSYIATLVFTYIPTIPIRFVQGIISNSQRLLDGSTKKFQCTSFLKFKSHYGLPSPLRL